MVEDLERPKDLDARAGSTTLAEECEAFRVERGAVSVGVTEEEARGRLSFDESIIYARWAKVREGRIAAAKEAHRKVTMNYDGLTEDQCNKCETPWPCRDVQVLRGEE